MAKEVGQFRIDDEGALWGPKAYMNEQGDAHLAKVLAGECVSFNMTAHLSPDVETAILVSLQTNYAGWKGVRDLLAVVQ